MNKPDTFDVMDEGLNERLDRLVRVLDSTNKTLEKVSTDLIAANERQGRQQHRLQMIYLILTAFIVLSACASAFFAYKSVTIAIGQKSLQSTEVFIDKIRVIKEIFDTLKYFAEKDQPPQKEVTEDAVKENDKQVSPESREADPK